MGFRNNADALKQMKALLRGSPDQEPKVAIAAVVAHCFHTWRPFGQGRACTREELDFCLMQLQNTMRQRGSLIRKGIKDFMRNLPRQGGPGRREALTPEQKLWVCDCIRILHQAPPKKTWTQLYKEGAEALAAQGITASARTVKRTWLKIGAHSIPTMRAKGSKLLA
jgi:hypothetical protein